jgi:hypothetical protein
MSERQVQKSKRCRLSEYVNNQKDDSPIIESRIIDNQLTSSLYEANKLHTSKVDTKIEGVECCWCSCNLIKNSMKASTVRQS